MPGGCTSPEEPPVIPVIGIPCRRFTAHVGHYPGDHKVFDLENAQNGFQVGIVERRIAMLEDHFFRWHWGQILMDLAFRTAFYAHAFPPPSHDAAVKVVGMMDVLCVDNRTVLLSERCCHFCDRRDDGKTAASVRGGLWIKEEILHVNDQQCALLPIQCHAVLVEGIDLLKPSVCLAGKGTCGHIRVHCLLLVVNESLTKILKPMISEIGRFANKGIE